MATKQLAVVVLLGAVLTACTPRVDLSPSPAASTSPERTDVDWTLYPREYQRIVDEETEAANCDALQDMFDAAPDDADLLAYLDEALRIADCY